MQMTNNVEVAVLLATHNGAQFLEQQVKSLAENSTRFTLHWIDDHSTDKSPETVRAEALNSGIKLKEWHRPQHLGVPGTFFELLESVEADIYLFCDQDDIWQPGKIDATVENLIPDIASAVLCCTDCFLFRNDNASECYRYSDVARVNPKVALQETRLFMSLFVNGHTQGFTRPLRDIYLTHKNIARNYASLHDEWMHVIATACGTVRLIRDTPTTLYRWHRKNASGSYSSWTGRGRGRFGITWRQQQHVRRVIAQHARGFILAAPNFPSSPKLQRLLEIAEIVATIDHWQSPVSLIRLAQLGGIWPNALQALRLALTCVCSSATR